MWSEIFILKKYRVFSTLGDRWGAPENSAVILVKTGSRSFLTTIDI